MRPCQLFGIAAGLAKEKRIVAKGSEGSGQGSATHFISDIGIVEKKMETPIVYWDDMGIMEKKTLFFVGKLIRVMQELRGSSASLFERT